MTSYVSNEALSPRALHERLGRLTERIKERFEEFEKRIGKLEEGMRELGEMASKLGELGDLLEEVAPTVAAMTALSERMDLLQGGMHFAPDEGLRLTQVEAGPTVPEVERTFRCLSCGQQSSHKKVDIPVEGSWKCKYCGGTTYHSGNPKE